VHDLFTYKVHPSYICSRCSNGCVYVVDYILAVIKS